MGFHHTLFVRQSIEDVDELKKYMYSGGNLRFLAPSLTAARSDATSSQAYIADEVGTPAPPFPHQEFTEQGQHTEQGTYGSAFGADAGVAGTPLERCAFICDEVARPPPSQEQGDVNVSQCLLTSTQDPIVSEGSVGKGLPCGDTTYERVAFKTKAHLSTERSTYGAGVDAERLIYAEHLRSAPPLLRSRGVAGGICAEGAYDRLRGQAVPLFWAIYIAIHGYEEYAQIGRGYSNFEINEKQKIVATIQNSPTILKQTNQKMTKDKIKEIMSEVMSGKNMGLSTLPAFATVYNKRIIVILKNTMRIDIATEGAEDTVVIRKNNKGGGNQRFPSEPSLTRAGGRRGAAAPCWGMFVPDLDANLGIIERETHCFHQIDKPLRPVSTYKLDELVGIAGLLEVPYENKKKPELYADLVRACII